jgi:hypothetical protein
MLLHSFRAAAVTEREKSTYFEVVGQSLLAQRAILQRPVQRTSLVTVSLETMMIVGSLPKLNI